MNKSRNNSLIGGLGILAHPSCVLTAAAGVIATVLAFSYLFQLSHDVLLSLCCQEHLVGDDVPMWRDQSHKNLDIRPYRISIQHIFLK